MQVLTLTAFDRAFGRIWFAGRNALRRIGAYFGAGSAGVVLGFVVLTQPDAARAEWSLGLYTGVQSAPHSQVSGDDIAGVGPFDFTAGWEGRPFAMPPHWGLRGIIWTSDSFGWFADFNHTKTYADSDTLGTGGTSGGFEVLEFSDGLNNFTLGPIWRWPEAWGRITPHVALGAGGAFPHVEVQTTPGSPKTFEYQFGGPSVSLSLGGSMPLGARTELFGEYKATYSRLDVDLVGGGYLKTNIITNALNAGIRMTFGR